MAIADGRAYFVGDKLYCVNLSTRTNEWAVSGSFGWTPVVASGIVYAISDEFVSAFTTNGVFVRQFGPTSLHGDHYGPLIVTDDVLIAVRAFTSTGSRTARSSNTSAATTWSVLVM